MRRSQKPKQPTRNNARPWTSSELNRLRELAGMDVDLIAEELGRSAASVRMAAHRNRISLRQPHSTNGLLLGQPRGVSWLGDRHEAATLRALRQLRADVLAGKVDPAQPERAVRRAWAVARGAPPCPACTRNPQENARTGLCTDCHLKELARAHREGAYDQSEARREHNREKQRSKRRRSREAG